MTPIDYAIAGASTAAGVGAVVGVVSLAWWLLVQFLERDRRL